MQGTITAPGRAAPLTSGDSSGERSSSGHGRRRGGLIGPLLRVPLFYKILIANATIVAAVGLACALLGTDVTSVETPAFFGLLLGGLALSVASNAVIVRLALSPLKRLEQTARLVQTGDANARVELSDLADRDLERLTTTFNTMLDAGEMYRRRIRETAAHALSAQEEERKRIARELHDGTAQTLAALRVQLRVARAVEDAKTRGVLLERISADLAEATEELRRIAQGLRPPALDMLGLAPAIESFARQTSDTAGLALETELLPVEGLLSPDAELALYRIVQEALSNVARHAAAGSVHVRLSYSGRFVTAAVEDDGRGFTVSDKMADGGLGLSGMQERAGYVGGTVDIDSEPGRGTRVRAIIPVLETARYA
jgi:two-component system, NarL family, sensor histidine kinase UhpB